MSEKFDEETLKRGMSVPAIYANLVNVAVTGMAIRLTFAERMNETEEPHFRGAMMIPIDTALSVADIIKRAIEDHPNIQITVVDKKPGDGQP